VEGFLRARREMELARQAQAIRRIACLELRIQLVRSLEKRRMERPPVALEPVAQGRERAISVHPLAQVAENLVACLVAVQHLQLGPLLGLRVTDEGEDRLRKDRALAGETV